MKTSHKNTIISNFALSITEPVFTANARLSISPMKNAIAAVGRIAGSDHKNMNAFFTNWTTTIFLYPSLKGVSKRSNPASAFAFSVINFLSPTDKGDSTNIESAIVITDKTISIVKTASTF